MDVAGRVMASREAGKPCAGPLHILLATPGHTVPGVYRGWLIAGDTRVGIRLLRTP